MNPSAHFYGSQYRMEHSMRWFGPTDPVPLSDLLQAGCVGVVSALHQVPVGEVWPKDAIRERKQVIEERGLKWNVVESLPVSEAIKTRTGNFRNHIKNYIQSLQNLAACGIRIVTYNFMPVFDWIRTDMYYPFRDGSKTLFYEKAAIAAFDLYMLERPDAAKDYLLHEIEDARQRYLKMTDAAKQYTQDCILTGLPGGGERFTLEQIRKALKSYESITKENYFENLVFFLEQVAPVAEAYDIQLAIHPDDPPYPVFGLPRIVSCSQDLEQLFSAVPSKNNGLCFCSGSLGVRADNDLPAMVQTFQDRIHFIHLRSTRRNERGDFYEDNHLEGDVDMYALMKVLLDLMQKRKTTIPMRPDHGHQMLDDLAKTTYPGYSAIGRLRSLAELRGLELGTLRSGS